MYSELKITYQISFRHIEFKVVKFGGNWFIDHTVTSWIKRGNSGSWDNWLVTMKHNVKKLYWIFMSQCTQGGVQSPKQHEQSVM